MARHLDPDEFDAAVRRALDDVAGATPPAADLATRLAAGARSGSAVPSLATRRRAARWSLPLLAAATVAVLAAGAAVGTTLLTDDKPAPPGHTLTPSPLPTATSAPTASPSSPRASSSAPTPSGGSSGGAGRPRLSGLTADAVRNATIDVPSWAAAHGGAPGCPAQRVTLHDAVATGLGANGAVHLEVVGDPAIEDVTGDGVADAVVILECGSATRSYAYRVLGLRSTGSGVAVIGDVERAVVLDDVSPDQLVGRPERTIAGSGGRFSVRWTDVRATGAAPQTRTYRYEDGSFVHVAGPPHFTDFSADLAISASDLVMVREGDAASGTISVVLRNDGPHRTDGSTWVSARLNGLRIASATDLTGHGYRVYEDLGSGIATIYVPRFAVGQRLVLRIGVEWPRTTAPPRKVRLQFGAGSGGIDPNPGNDTADVTISTR